MKCEEQGIPRKLKWTEIKVTQDKQCKYKVQEGDKMQINIKTA